MNIKEAAAVYEVSRAKLHRMVRLGRLNTEKDPRDERATLLKTDELDAIFHFPMDDTVNTEKSGWNDDETEAGATASGALTSEMRAHVDALRMRVSAGKRVAGDSADIIREGRESRSAALYQATTGKDAPGVRRRPGA